jgi:hypothetical protein
MNKADVLDALSNWLDAIEASPRSGHEFRVRVVAESSKPRVFGNGEDTFAMLAISETKHLKGGDYYQPQGEVGE